MPISCNAGDLIESSKCILSCTDEGQRDAMKVWLLAQIAGVEAAPGFLLEQSKCLNCLNEGQLKAIQAWLLCQAANKICPPCPPCPPLPECPGVSLTNVSAPVGSTYSVSIVAGVVIVSFFKAWAGPEDESFLFDLKVTEGCCAWLGKLTTPRTLICGVFGVGGTGSIIDASYLLNGTTSIDGNGTIDTATPCVDPLTVDPTPWVHATTISVNSEIIINDSTEIQFKFNYNNFV